MKKKQKRKGTPGRKPETLVIAGNWKDAIKKSFEKESPNPKKQPKN